MIYPVHSTGARFARASRPRRPRRDDVQIAVIVLLLNSGTYLIPGVVPWGPWRFLLETATIVPLLWRETYPVLVPTVLALLGERAWWAPRTLRAVHARFGVEEAAELVATDVLPQV